MLLAVPVPGAAAVATSTALSLRVTNPLDRARLHAVVSLPLARIRRLRPDWRGGHFAVRVEGRARRLPTQLYARHGGPVPDHLLVQLDLAAHASVNLRIQPTDKAYVPAVNPLFARIVPERYGDFAWENETVAFRLYRTPLEAAGQVFSGLDVWSKKPGRHVINDWYAGDARGRSYHVDHGEGLDSYAVGHTPGDGGVAAWRQGAPVYSRNATTVKITAMGPIRLRFVVDYAPWRVGRMHVREHKIVTLDAGSHFNRQCVQWRIDGGGSLQVAAGVAVHAGARLSHHRAMRLAVWDTPQKAGAGRIATGLILAPGQTAHFVRSATAAWQVFDVSDGQSIRFASGAGWSKGDVADFFAWKRRMKRYRLRWAHPLAVSWPASPGSSARQESR